MSSLALLLVGLVAVQAKPPDAIEAPSRIVVSDGRQVTFKVKAPACVKWVNLSPDVDLHAPGDGKSVAVVVSRPGSYRIAALACSSSGLLDPVYVDLVRTGAETPPKSPSPDGKSGSLDPRRSIVRLSFPGKGCTATVIGPRRPDGRWDVVTASHCTDGIGSKGKITTQDGTVLGVTVAARDTKPDLCWLVTDESGLELSYALLADDTPAAGRKVWHAGYGTDKPGNVETGEVLSGEGSTGMIAFLLSVSPGDSGGGIFDEETGRWVGGVCCTSGMARKATMYAGGPRAAARLRPGRAAATEEPPAVMPILIGLGE